MSLFLIRPPRPKLFPGLRALYFPYRDILGRNVLSSLSVQNGTVSSGVFTEDSSNSLHAVTFQPISPTANSIAAIVKPRGRSLVALGYTGSKPYTSRFAIFDLANGTVARNLAANGTASISSLDNGEYFISANYLDTSDYTSNQFDIASAAGTDGTTSEVLINGISAPAFEYRLPQINLGYLAPYSPPAGLPQWLTDYSGHGNRARLGGTDGVDAADPLVLSNALKHLTDDNTVTGPVIGVDGLRPWTVGLVGLFNGTGGTVIEMRAAATAGIFNSVYYQVAGILQTRSRNAVSSNYGATITVPTDAYTYIFLESDGKEIFISGLSNGFAKQTGTPIVSGQTEACNLYLGGNFSVASAMTWAFAHVQNRIMGTAEKYRHYRYIKNLLAAEGGIAV